MEASAIFAAQYPSHGTSGNDTMGTVIKIVTRLTFEKLQEWLAET
jgi:hypothetical protein